MGSQPQMSRGWPRTFLPRALMGSVVAIGWFKYPTFVGGCAKMGTRLEAFEDGLDAIGGPEEIVLLDDEGRCEADDVVVRLLAEDALLHERFADGARRGVQLDGDPEAAATDFADVRADNLSEAVEEESAEFGGAFGEALFDEDLEGGAGDGAGHGVAAEGAAVVARAQDAEDLARGEDCGDGIETASEGFADDEDVGGDALVHVGEELAGAAEAGLDLVGHEEDAVLLADGCGLCEEAVGRDEDAGLSLDGLDEEGAGVGCDGLAEGLGVAEGDDLEAGQEGAEAFAVLVVGGEADDGDGAAVEVVGADDDLGLVGGDSLDGVAPLAGDLEGGLDGLGAGVHGERHLEAGEAVQLLVEEGELVVAEG